MTRQLPMDNFLSQKLYLCFLLSFFFLKTTYAAHIIGGEMTYKFVQKVDAVTNRYDFTMIVYKDCFNGADLDNPAYIGLFKGSYDNADFQYKRNAARTSIETIDPIAPDCADLNQLPNNCAQRGVYTWSLDLTIDAVESYFIVYQRCCRTAAINNIVTPDQWGSTYFVEITPTAQTNQNSSPTFNSYPPSYICSRYLMNLDHSASDIDGDSLVYSFCNPLHGGSQGGGGGGGGGCNNPRPNPPCGPPFDLVTFLGGYTAQAPMGGLPTVKVDATTGYLSGQPILKGNFVVGICVQEYRNGVLLSTVIRDFQFTVVDCERIFSPTVDAQAIDYNEFLIETCGILPVFVDNTTQMHPSLTSWFWRFPDINGVPFTSSDFDITLPVSEYGNYDGWLYLNPNGTCSDSALVHVNAYPGITADFEYTYDICSKSAVDFANLSFSASQNGIKGFEWDFGTINQDSSISSNPSFLFDTANYYNVTMIATDGDDCKDTAQVLVDYNPRILDSIPDYPAIRACYPTPITFDFLKSPSYNGSTISWDLGDGKTRMDRTITDYLYEIGAYDVNISIKSQYDCMVEKAFPALVSIFSTPTANFSYTPKDLSNLAPDIRLEDKSSSDVVNWTWDIGENTSILGANPSHVFQDTGLVEITLHVTTAEGCADSISQIVDVVPLLRLYVPNVIRPSLEDNLGNDQFKVFGILPGYKTFNLQVWDRWGELVYQSTDPEESWSGRSLKNDKFVQSGVYIYHIQVLGPRGDLFEYKDTLTVLGL